MKQSKMFIPLRREAPKDERFANAQLLIRAGFMDKVSAGVFTMLPLGLKVLTRIEDIIREEMQALGAEELSMPSLQTPPVWEETGRWASLRPEMFQLRDRDERPLGLAMTHEEVAFDLIRRTTHSHHELPRAIYQFQTKFRDEPRPKSGLIRGREFLMKDLYSFHASSQDLDRYYEEVARAYERVFSRCGLKAFRVEASGGVFTDNPSHEFQVVAESGEDHILLCATGDFGANAEVGVLPKACPRCRGTLKAQRAVEVGNIFRFYDSYATKMAGFVQGRARERTPIHMGSYGIGLGRLMATVVEVSHDKRGIVWPEAIAPFTIHLLALGQKNEVFQSAAVYAETLQNNGFSVLYDDRRAMSAGEKLASADLLGCPWRAVVSEKTLAQKKIEIKQRTAEEAQLIGIATFMNQLGVKQ